MTLDHYARCSGAGCMSAAVIYLGERVPLCAEHVHAVRDHLAATDDLPRRPTRGRSIKDPDRAALVYYGRSGDTVKIGSTYSPARRWATLRRTHGTFVVLAAESGGQAVEYQRHAEYVGLREGMTEWFRWEAPLREHVERLAASPWRTLVEQTDTVCREASRRGVPALRY